MPTKLEKLFAKAMKATGAKATSAARASSNVKPARRGTFGMSASKVPSVVHGLPADGQYVGTCQACFGQYVVKQAKSGESRAGSGDGFERYRAMPRGSLVVVLHGYTRPGYGATVGECPGRGAEPFELSKDLTEKFKSNMQHDLEGVNQYISRLKTGTLSFDI